MTWSRLLRRVVSRRTLRVVATHRPRLAATILAITTATTGAVPSTPPSAPPSAPTPPAPAPPVPPGPRWRAPVDGPIRVTRRFDPPSLPWLAGHRGADLAARPGERIRAAGAGRVGYAGDVGGRGVVTILHDGGLRTTYLPVRPLVARGALVRPGDVIGVLEPLPGHCPAGCLHWGLLRGDRYLDPLLLLGGARVRLLPFWHVPFGSPGPPAPATTSGVR